MTKKSKEKNRQTMPELRREVAKLRRMVEAYKERAAFAEAAHEIASSVVRRLRNAERTSELRREADAEIARMRIERDDVMKEVEELRERLWKLEREPQLAKWAREKLGLPETDGNLAEEAPK